MRFRLATAMTLLGGCLVAGCGDGAPPTPATHGAHLYVANCIACHLPKGEGVKGLQPPLAGTPVTIGEPADLLGWVMFGQRPAALPKGVYGGIMPQFSYLSDADLAALLTHVRSSFGNHASPVTPAMVAAARAAHQSG
ncbi:MAG TPA: cytochrome c [Steroidobacteraceae bacterium]|nr:cytochrome c [Steroidobacteraceae bacterium]